MAARYAPTTAPSAAIKCAMYLRQSLDKTGEALAISRQRDACLALVAEKDWEPVEYADNDISASTGKPRPAYTQLLADIESGAIGAVVCRDLDRLHRRPVELEDDFGRGTQPV